MRAWPSRTSSSFRGPTPRNEYRPSRSPPSTDSSRYAGVVPSSRRRKAPMGVSRSAARVARNSSVSAFEASRLAWVRLSGSLLVTMLRLRLCSENRNDLPSRDERSSLPRSHPHSAMPHLPDRQMGAHRSALPCIAGALRRSLLRLRLAPAFRSGGSRVHSPPPPPRFPPPPRLSADARRVLVPFIARIRLGR